MSSVQLITADLYRYIVGIDTHAATHSYAILETGTGRILDQKTFPTHAKGLSRALAWIRRRTSDDPAATLVSAECTGSYGAVITERLQMAGWRVVEAPTPWRAGGAKTDPIDATAAATGAAVMLPEQLRDWRAGEVGQALQVLSTARKQMNRQRTSAVNTLTALLRRFDLGLDARRALKPAQIRTVAGWRVRSTDSVAVATARAESVRLATQIARIDEELATNYKSMTDPPAPPRSGGLRSVLVGVAGLALRPTSARTPSCLPARVRFVAAAAARHRSVSRASRCDPRQRARSAVFLIGSATRTPRTLVGAGRHRFAYGITQRG